MDKNNLPDSFERIQLRRLIEQDPERVIDLILELKTQNLALQTQVVQLAEKVA